MTAAASRVPPKADVVIVGGGVVGCAAAWALTREPGLEVVVLERNQLASGATPRAAALLSRMRPYPEVSAMVAETYRCVTALEDELGESLALREVGSVNVAVSHAGKAGLRALVDASRAAGTEVVWLDPAEAQEKAPWLSCPDDGSVAWVPGDGFLDPYRLTGAYARSARGRGAAFVPRCGAVRILTAGGRVTGVETPEGVVEAPRVVDAAGAWSPLLAAEVGAFLPLAPVRSQYWLTAPDRAFPPRSPMALLLDVRCYARPELGALLFGVRELESVCQDPRTLPDELTDYVIAGDAHGWGYLEEELPSLSPFVPRLADVGIAHYVSGFSTYTPDGCFVLGAAGPEGFFAASGCCGGGIAASGGFGRAVAALVRGEPCPYDLARHRPDRLGPVDPFSEPFLRRCGEARSGKRTG